MKIYISALVGVTGQTLLGGFIDAFKMPLPETKKLLEDIGKIMTNVDVSIVRFSDGLRLDVIYERFNPVPIKDMVLYIEKACNNLGLSVGKEFALNSVSDMISKYKQLTNSGDDTVIDFLSTPESLIYIVGLAYIYEKGKLSHADIICSDINIGGGQVSFNKQFYYVPSPIVKMYLDGFKWKFSKNGEMIDPVGACMIKRLSSRQEDSFLNGRVGIGYSSKSFEGVPGRTRIVISN